MPFLDTVESPDALAVWDLEKVENYRTNDFLSIMSHANVSDGITDQEAKVVAVLSSANRYKPDSLPILLDGLDGTNGVYLEERTIEATHSGEVQLTIIRVHDKDTPNMDRLEHAVRVVEEFMGEPLPTNYVAWYLDDAARSVGKGYHAGTHITSSLVYDIVDGDSKSRTPMQHIAHEVGHYYFRSNTHQWLDEGPAKFFESISERERVGRPVAYFRQSCGPAKTIQEQEELRNDIKAGRVTPPDGWTGCDYYLGERFFVDLYLAMGDEAFRPGLRSLYLKSQHDDPTDDCEGTDLSLCHVEAAFKTGVSDDVAAKVDEVIDRWYYGVAPVSTIADLPNGAWLEENKTELAYRLKALPWVADGVDDSEREAAEALIAAAIWYPDTFNALLQMAWVVDDVTEHETTVIRWIRWTAKDAPALAEPMLQKSWVQDGITRDEATVIERLYWIIRAEDESLQQEIVQKAIEILSMPFLDSVESADAMAVQDLRRIARSRSSDFLDIMASPKVNDGITDQEAKVVAALSSAYRYKPESLPILLDGLDGTGSVYLQEHDIELPLAGEVLLAIIRLRDRITPSMDYLELAVRFVEEFMNEPLPTNYVAWYFDDATVTGGGHNSFTHIASNPRHDDVDDPYWQDTPGHIAHEAAHYYWRGFKAWLNEGPANFLESLSENVRIGTPVEANIQPCAYAANIAELEPLETKPGDDAFICNYSLGERFFLDLYHTLGRELFQQGFRGLYLKSLQDYLTDDCEGTDLAICHVEAAFKAGASDDVVAEVDEIIDRWYYGTEPYDLSGLDNSSG